MSERPDTTAKFLRAMSFIAVGTLFGLRFAMLFVHEAQIALIIGFVLSWFAATVYWFSDSDGPRSPRDKGSATRREGLSPGDAGRGAADPLSGQRPSRGRKRRKKDEEATPALKEAQAFSERAPHVPSSATSVLRIVALCVAAGFLFFGLVLDDFETTLALGGGLGGLVGCTAALLFWLYRAFPRRTISILVGVDGVRIGSTVVPYSDIKEVRLEGAQSSDSYVKTLVLLRRRRPPIRVASLYFPLLAVTAADNVRRASMVTAVEEGLSAWLARRDNPDLTAEEILSRGRSAPAEWLIRLRALGSGATATYREAALSKDTLSRLLTSPAAKPSTRAAAAIALKAAEDSPSGEGLRIGSAAFVDTKLRVAAGELESASDDEALLEALKALEAAERRAWAPPKDE